jgi:hypothetical protein
MISSNSSNSSSSSNSNRPRCLFGILRVKLVDLILHVVLHAHDVEKTLSYLNVSIWSKMTQWFLEYK